VKVKHLHKQGRVSSYCENFKTSKFRKQTIISCSQSLDLQACRICPTQPFVWCQIGAETDKSWRLTEL